MYLGSTESIKLFHLKKLNCMRIVSIRSISRRLFLVFSVWLKIERTYVKVISGCHKRLRTGGLTSFHAVCAQWE